jgi:mono/diheme cytochrome c family protein
VGGQTDIGQNVVAIFAGKCNSCHSGPNPKGGLDLTDLANIGADAGDKILARITTADPTKRMPRTAGGAGLPLNINEIKTIFAAAGYTAE